MEAAAEGAGSTIWTLPRSTDLIWRDWDDSGAVYDAGSGRTHVLSALGMELLAMLHTAPRSETELLLELAGDMPDGLESEEAMFHVGWQLQQLQLLGLAEPATIRP